MAGSIRVLVCDDHALVRSGLHKLLECEPDLEVVGEAANADQAAERSRVDRPDVLLLDVVMPGRSGIDALPDILQTAPATKVLVLSMHDDPAYVRNAFAAGASGYVLKDAADTELVEAIHTVAEGRRYLHPLLGARLAATEATAGKQAVRDPLSEREHQVLRLLALGHTNQEIAKQLFVSVRTAETHRARIVQKLGVKTRAEIVRYAFSSGELDSEQQPPSA
jgi:two-component system, NarL family, response regulator NreC